MAYLWDKKVEHASHSQQYAALYIIPPGDTTQTIPVIEIPMVKKVTIPLLIVLSYSFNKGDGGILITCNCIRNDVYIHVNQYLG